MKKSFIAIVVTAALASSVMAQGLVNFSGGTSAATRTSTNSVVGGVSTGLTVGGTTSFYYALFASSANSTINGSSAGISGTNANYVFNNLAGWTFVGMATNNASAGRFNAATQGAAQSALNGDGSLTVSGIAGANTANLVVVGWAYNTLTGTIGNTLQALENWYSAGANGGWIGQSAIASVTLGDGGSVITPNPFGSGAGQVGGILLGETPSVPEPGSIALAVIGAGSLLMFRRKNK